MLFYVPIGNKRKMNLNETKYPEKKKKKGRSQKVACTKRNRRDGMKHNVQKSQKRKVNNVRGNRARKR